jgi:neutral ceramidase
MTLGTAAHRKCEGMPGRISVVLLAFSLFVSPLVADWKAGLARKSITPTEPIWMSGYASRDHAAEGTETELWAKAIVLEDEAGTKVLAVTLDLVGIDRETSIAIRRRIADELKIPVERSALLCSHTHCGPVVGTNLLSMYALSDAERDKIRSYTAGLIETVVSAAQAAVEDLSPAEISYGSGQATFAVNRRTNPEASVPMLREKGELKGPVDHAVPVLSIRSNGKLRGLLFGYACHSTTLSYFKWCGDYPGFAMQDLEAQNPGAIALFWAGCGADQNPLPRRTVELAKSYGAQLASAVTTVVNGPMWEVSGKIQTQYSETPLVFAHLPSRAELDEAAKSTDRYEASRATHLLTHFNRDGHLSESYPYPVQSWRLGNGPTWVTLGGEVVVDYALTLKQQWPDSSLWVAGYANDVMAYIPSLRVLKEGGYEGGGSMVYYGHPSPWNDEVEARILKEVGRQIRELGLASTPSKSK